MAGLAISARTMLQALRDKKVEIAYVTCMSARVRSSRVRAENIEEHVIATASAIPSRWPRLTLSRRRRPAVGA